MDWNLEGVRTLLERLLGQASSARGHALAEALQRETEGNPFFMEEVVRHLQESGKLYRRDGRWTSDAVGIAELGIPEGVREVIGRRLSRLPEETNRLLTLASVVGREFESSLLERLSGLNEDALDEALAEAEAARVVEAAGKGGRYRFVHALVRETLYSELPSRRRVRLHRQVGEALEALDARSLEGHLSELAYHFLEGAAGGEIDKAVDYARRAGQRAMQQGGYEVAARLFEQALQALDEEEVEDNGLRCDLLLELGQALIAAGEPRRAADEMAPRAFALAEALPDPQRAANSASLALFAVQNQGGDVGRRPARMAAVAAPAGTLHAGRQCLAGATRYCAGSGDLRLVAGRK